MLSRRKTCRSPDDKKQLKDGNTSLSSTLYSPRQLVVSVCRVSCGHTEGTTGHCHSPKRSTLRPSGLCHIPLPFSARLSQDEGPGTNRYPNKHPHWIGQIRSQRGRQSARTTPLTVLLTFVGRQCSAHSLLVNCVRVLNASSWFILGHKTRWSDDPKPNKNLNRKHPFKT